MLYGDKYPDKHWLRWRPKAYYEGWVGIKRKNGVWAWSNGAPIHRPKWEHERGSKGDIDCAEFGIRYKRENDIWGLKWYTLKCDHRTSYACEYKGGLGAIFVKMKLCYIHFYEKHPKAPSTEIFLTIGLIQYSKFPK